MSDRIVGDETEDMNMMQVDTQSLCDLYNYLLSIVLHEGHNLSL